MDINSESSNIIGNRASLLPANNNIRQLALDTIEAGINAVLPDKLISNKLAWGKTSFQVVDSKLNFNDYQQIYLIGVGKASLSMARPIYNRIGHFIEAGVLITDYLPEEPELGPVEVIEGGHPTPDKNGVEGTDRLLELAKIAGPDDLVITLISGGGSALACSPVQGLSLSDLVQATKVLINSGLPIDEINAVRKQLSRVKGGRLARRIHPAQGLTLIISDVAGNSLETIASGPTVPVQLSRSEAVELLKDHELMSDLPPVVQAVLLQNNKETTPKTVTAEEFLEFRMTNHIIGDNRTALESMARIADRNNFSPLILSSMIVGESSPVGALHGNLGRSVKVEGLPVEPPAALLSGGEVTVTVDSSSGTGGPNQEFVLSAAQQIDGLEDIAVIAVDSDGRDGATEAAGGVVDGQSYDRLNKKEVSSLDGHNSYPILNALGGLVETGYTGTNVNDLRAVIVGN